jgi:flagellar protein FlaF
MGFGTSGSLLLIFAGLFLAMSGLYTVTANTAENVADARTEQSRHHHAIQTTTVEIVDASWDQSASNLTIRANNTGETTLSVAEADVLVDGRYVPVEAFDRREVDGEPTDVWRPGEQLVLEENDALTAAPGRVKLVTGPGVAAIAEVGS